MDAGSNTESKTGRLDQFLRLFSDVRSGEGVIASLLALNIFLILTAYYILKPVREALILGQGSAELKSYMSVGQALLLAVVVPLYARLVARLPPTISALTTKAKGSFPSLPSAPRWEPCSGLEWRAFSSSPLESTS